MWTGLSWLMIESSEILLKSRGFLDPLGKYSYQSFQEDCIPGFLTPSSYFLTTASVAKSLLPSCAI
jgi:hypothetical protein